MSPTGSAFWKALLRLTLAMQVLLRLNSAEAQEFDNIPVLFEIETGSINPTLQPLVMVNGELAGMIGGYVALSAKEEAIVEIGIPSATLPFYSFVFGPEAVEAKAIDFVMTTYTLQPADAGLWQRVVIEPNQRATTKLDIMPDGSFVAVLPAHPYESFHRILEEGEVQQFGENWLEAVPAENDRSGETGTFHLSASKTSERWSGADLYTAWAWGGGMGRREKVWLVVSDPKEASIHSQQGEHGVTDRRITLPDVSETYIVLRLTGHYDCSSATCGCERHDTPSEVQLSCTLKPYR